MLIDWLLQLEASDVPERLDARRNGYALAQLAVVDGLVASDEHGHGELARLLGDLHADGWVAWDWQVWPNDDQPATGRMFQPVHLQRIDNLRLTPQGIAAHAARPTVARSLSTPPPGPAEGDDSDGDDGDLRDVFISHASEDKDAIARPLKEELLALGHSVWFDELELLVGSSLSESIDDGLARSRFGVVILSERFFAKRWPKRELQGLVAKEMAGGERLILPVLHGVTPAQVADASPPLADLLAANSDDGVGAVAAEISRAIARRRRLEDARGRPMPARPAPGSPQAQQAREAQDHVALRDEFVGLLRADDEVGVREMLRAERRHLDAQLLPALARAADAMGSAVDRPALEALEASQWTVIERRAATLLPVIEYAPQLLDDELASLVALAGRRVPTRSTLEMWQRSTRPAVWMLVHLLGAWAVTEGRWGIVAKLWNARDVEGSSLAAFDAEPAGRLADELARARPRTAISSDATSLWHLAFRVVGSDFIIERYSELVSAPGIDDPVSAVLSRIGDFSWLATALTGRAGGDIDQLWRAGQVHPTLPARIAGDGQLQEAIAMGVFGTDNFQLAGSLDEWLSRAGGRRRFD